MKQLFQLSGSSLPALVDVPAPIIKDGYVLIRTTHSLISTGTERATLNANNGGIIASCIRRPEKIKRVINLSFNEGLSTAIQAVNSSLNNATPLGYSNVGIVVQSNCPEFKEGDRVLSNGHHAQYVSIPKNLCVKIPDQVSNYDATFGVLGSIALQGVRLLKPEIGENILVLGLGLVGLLTVQILKSNGCNVLASDLSPDRCKLGKDLGIKTINTSIEDLLEAASSFSGGVGVDGVIIATSTMSNAPISQAAKACRKRGRIVMVGVSGLDIKREDFYEKELSFQVSASYGPGRYDSFYEQDGNDYPIGFVRWTENRNFEAVLSMISSGLLNVTPLISGIFQLERASEAYQLLSDPLVLGIILDYGIETNSIDIPGKKLELISEILLQDGNVNKVFRGRRLQVSFIGAGNYAGNMLIPAFKKFGAFFNILVSGGSLKSVALGKKYKFNKVSTDINSVVSASNEDAIVIATRHNQHAEQVIYALKFFNNIYVEKPLAIDDLGLEKIAQELHIYTQKNERIPNLIVGFNRRFSPHVIKMKELLDARHEAKVIIITVNAGYIPPNHWVNNIKEGGGRVNGECCHFIDLAYFLIGCPIKDFSTANCEDSLSKQVNDRVVINLMFDDGSLATIIYLSNGSKSFQKERIEVFCGGSILQLNNYQKMIGYEWPGFKSMYLWREDKGQFSCVEAFLSSCETGIPVIPINEILEVTRITIQISKTLRIGRSF